MPVNEPSSETGPILVCDDERGILDVVRLVLERRGYEVASCESGAEVLGVAATLQPAVIFLDLWMPGQDGAAVLQQLRANPETVSTPVVIMSASRDAEVVARRLGADGCLTKPFAIEELETLAERFTALPAAS